MTNDIRLIIAGGGTGGHLYPGLAIAAEMTKRSAGSKILFVTGRRKMEMELLRASGFDQASIDVEGLKGRGWKNAIGVVFKLPLSFFQSVSIIRGFSPKIVVGVGGYSAGPVCLAAKMMGIPSAIHEQNSFPGLTNRLLCRVVDRVFISFEESRAHFPKGSLLLTGNPVRQELLAGKAARREGDIGFTILVMGGSQGARAINDAFVKTLEILKQRGRAVRVIHQTGEADHARIVDAYRQHKLEGEITPFIRDMAGAYGRADIVVSRAGATTISELAALGKPSILIPYPYAANRHQETNAKLLVDEGGAEMILQDGLSGERLAETLLKYMDDRKALEQMGIQAKKQGRWDATKKIVDQLMEMMM